MRRILPFVVMAIGLSIAVSCVHRLGEVWAEVLAKTETTEDGTGKRHGYYYYPDTIYHHYMGEHYEEGDSSKDMMMVYEMYDNGQFSKVHEIYDSAHVISVYIYKEDTIIKYTYIEGLDDAFMYSEYLLDERCNIKKLTQTLLDTAVISEIYYDYDMNGHLSMIYFATYEQQCKWLWRDGDLERIVWEDGEETIEFDSYASDPEIPYSATYFEMPKLDKGLSRAGYFGEPPVHAIRTKIDVYDDDTYDISFYAYLPDSLGHAGHIIGYIGVDQDSMDVDLHWKKYEW